MKIRVLRKFVFWYWRMEGRNGKVHATSETYFSRSNALRAARAVSKQTGVDVVDD